MHRLASVGLIVIFLVGCSGTDDSVGVARTTARLSQTVAASTFPSLTPEPTASPSPSPTPTTSPSPTPAALAPEIAEFNVVPGDFQKTLMVRIHNPNEGIGLIRTGFELTAVADDGSILDVYGTEGLLGASCCTIYQLPPRGDIGLAINMDQAAADPVSLELAITGRWVEWSTVEVPTSELSEVAVNLSEFGGPQVVGRVTTPSAPEDGPFNVNVIAIVDSPIGMLVLSGFVECVATADARAFSIDSSISPVSLPFTIRDSFAYTSTVPGVTEIVPNC